MLKLYKILNMNSYNLHSVFIILLTHLLKPNQLWYGVI